MPTASTSVGLILVAAALCPTHRVVAQAGPDIVWSSSGHTSAVNSVVFSLDGTLVAAGKSDGTIQIWSAASGSQVITISNQNVGVLQISFRSNGSLCSWDIASALKVWRVSNGALEGAQQFAGVGWRTAFAPDGDLFAIAGSVNLEVRRVSEGTLLRTFVSNQDASPAFSPNGHSVAAGLHFAERYEIYVWRLSDGVLVRTFSDVNPQSSKSLYGPPVFSADSARIAALTYPYGATELWDMQSGNFYGIVPEETGAPGQTLYAKLLVFAPDGRTAIMSDRDDRIRIWQIRPGTEAQRLAVYDVETAGINTLAMSPDGKVFAYGRQDGKVIVARVPLFIIEVSLRSNELVLGWAGRSGPYQMQQRTNLTLGNWGNVGIATTNTATTNAITGSSVFYRVQSLPN
jgi:WD40 repeat protein